MADIAADNAVLEAVNCNLCGATDERLLFLKDGFRIVRCNSCGLIFVKPRPGKEYLRKIYSEDYYKISSDASVGYRDYEADRQFHAVNSIKLLKTIESYKDKGTLLDVGCALGFFLVEAKARGWDVYGTELSPYAAGIAREKGFEVLSRDIMDAGFKRESFDVIVCLGTIEHFANPLLSIRHIRQLLKADGLLVISTPDAGGLLGGRRFQYKPREHLYYFTRKTIMALLQKEGFEVFFIKSEWLTKPVSFITERVRYYFPVLKNFITAFEAGAEKAGILNANLRIPTGQIIVYARRCSKQVEML